jgi:archaellum component FlaC
MNIAELKKIVQDGKNKFKAYDDADKAILQIESLGQAVNDLEASISTLKKEKEKASADLVSTKDKYDAELKKFDFSWVF